MRNAKTEKLLKRSRAAEMLAVGARTLRRWEIEGVLAAVKLNCRLTCYRSGDVQRLLEGRVQTVPASAAAPPITRAVGGQFAAAQSRHTRRP